MHDTLFIRLNFSLFEHKNIKFRIVQRKKYSIKLGTYLKIIFVLLKLNRNELTLFPLFGLFGAGEETADDPPASLTMTPDDFPPDDDTSVPAESGCLLCTAATVSPINII